eukprot:COSAG01_NODE_14_length_41020_cov_40.702133_8_plen_151_part_00
MFNFSKIGYSYSTMLKIIVSLSFFIFIGGCVYLLQYFVSDPRSHSLNYTSVSWDTLDLKSERLLSGQYHFEQRCNKCHGKYGESPVLTRRLNDKQWFNGDGSLDNLFTIIANGLPNKKMYGWKHKLKKDDLINLSLYVKHLSEGEPHYVQ